VCLAADFNIAVFVVSAVHGGIVVYNWWVAPMLLLMMRRWRNLSRSSWCSVHLALAASQGSASKSL
jgi:hypothetical protein